MAKICLNPLRLQYVILRTKSQNRCDSCTYTYTDFAIEIWGFYRHLTDTLRYWHTRCSRASGLWHPLVSIFTKSEEKWSLLGVCPLFLASFVKLPLADRTKFNSSLGLGYNGELYGLSAVKVKLVWVEEHSFPAAFVHGRRWQDDLTHVRVFILDNLFSKFPYFNWRFV